MGVDVDFNELSLLQLKAIAIFCVKNNRDTAEIILKAMKLDLYNKENYIAQGEMHRIRVEEIQSGKNFIACIEEAIK